MNCKNLQRLVWTAPKALLSLPITASGAKDGSRASLDGTGESGTICDVDFSLAVEHEDAVIGDQQR
jgi:hypothetical protein